MTRTSLKEMNCSIAQFAEILGDKWGLLILRDALVGVTTFSEFERRIGLSKNVLTERLNRLVDNGVMAKVSIRPNSGRYRYELTEKGKALFPIAVSIMQWSDKWVFGNEGEPIKVVDGKGGAPIQSVEVIARDGRTLSSDDVEYRPGPRGGRPYNQDD